jgi:hypothetical protein
MQHNNAQILSPTAHQDAKRGGGLALPIASIDNNEAFASRFHLCARLGLFLAFACASLFAQLINLSLNLSIRFFGHYFPLSENTFLITN